MINDVLKLSQLRIQVDAPALHEIYLAASSQPGCPFEYRTMHYEEFCNWLAYDAKHRSHDYYVIRCNNEVVGFCMTYRFRLLDRTTFLFFFMNDTIEITEKTQVVRKLIKKVFDRYPLRKIFVTSVEGQMDRETLLKEVGFNIALCLKAHRYYGKTYLDENIWEIESEILS